MAAGTWQETPLDGVLRGAHVTIYALKDPSTDEVRYIGKTIDLESRLRSHRHEARSDRFSTHKVRWLRSLSEEPLVEVLEVAGDDWDERERYWIDEYRRRGANLTNFAPGGQTSPVEGRGHSEESRAKMRASALANGTKPPSRKGQPVSEQARQNMRAAALRRGTKPPARGGWNKGRKATPEEVEKNRQGHIGKPWSEARRAAHARRTQESKVS